MEMHKLPEDTMTPDIKKQSEDIRRALEEKNDKTE